jgi:hypothetical protein
MTRWLIALLALAALAACSTAVEVPNAASTGAAPTTVASVNFPALIIVSATQAERPPSSARCNLYGTGL